MIAADILIAPRSPDAPAATPQAARPSEGADFAQVLAQTLPQAAKAGAKGAAADAAAAEGLALPPVGEDAATAPASALLLADRAAAVALPAGTTPAAAGDPMAVAAGATLSGAAPSDAAPSDAALSDANPFDAAGMTPTALPPDAGISPPGSEAVLPDTATPSGTDSPADAPTDAAATTAASAGDTTKASDADATEGTKAPGESDTPAKEPTSEPEAEAAQDAAPAAAAEATPPAMPPLATLIQPLIAPLSGKGGDSAEPADQGEVTGSAPRPRGMSGRLAMLTDAKATAPDSAGEPGPAFADRLALTGTASQDRVPAPADGLQTAPRDHLADSGTETAETLTTQAQPLPLDTRASPPASATPQRLPDAAPLDTTRSGWEAALTERITAHDTELGKEIEISLTPENLGHIRIKLDLSDKAASVQIVTDTPQAAQLFQQSEARLADALNRAGLSLTSHDASARDPGARDGGQGGQRQGQGPGNPRAEAALVGLRGTLAPPPAAGRAANLVNIVA